MVIVDPANYAQIVPLVRSSGLHGHITFAHAVLEGRQPGFVTAAGDLGSPQSAMVCNYSGFFLAFGVPDSDLVETTLEALPRYPFDELGRSLFGSSPEWVALLTELLADQPQMKRLGFVWRPTGDRPPVDWRSRIPPELALTTIDAALAETILDGTGTQDFGVDPWFIRIAQGPQAYAELGLGLALVERDTGQIASLCGVCALGGGEAEMEVGTPLGYRGRGLATLVSAAFMEQAQAQGWHPAYTCDSENLPSIGVAHKLGFVEVEEITGFQLS